MPAPTHAPTLVLREPMALDTDLRRGSRMPCALKNGWPPKDSDESEPKLRSEDVGAEVVTDDEEGNASGGWNSCGRKRIAGGGTLRCKERTASDAALAAAAELTGARFCGKKDGPGENG